jgi:thioredoxin reductase (NADPH)
MSTRNEIERKDIIIIGAGPAGLSAAIFAGLDGWDTMLLESGWVGGQGTIAYTVGNYPGFPPGDGKALMDNFEKRATSSPPAGVGTDLRYEEATDIDAEEFVVTAGGNRYKGEAIILATGSTMQTLGVPGEEKFAGRGVSYYAVRDGEKFDGKKVMVVGGGNTTAKSALFAKQNAAEVILIHRRGSMRAYPAMVKKLQKEGITIRYNTEVKEIKGTEEVESVVLFNNDTSAEEEMQVDWVVICVGTVPNTGLAEKAGFEMTGGFVKVDDRMMTSVDGIFACGEITEGPRRIVNCAAEGASAGMSASEYLAVQMVKRGEMFEGAKNGKYADEYLSMLGKI